METNFILITDLITANSAYFLELYIRIRTFDTFVTITTISHLTLTWKQNTINSITRRNIHNTHTVYWVIYLTRNAISIKTTTKKPKTNEREKKNANEFLFIVQLNEFFAALFITDWRCGSHHKWHLRCTARRGRTNINSLLYCYCIVF